MTRFGLLPTAAAAAAALLLLPAAPAAAAPARRAAPPAAHDWSRTVAATPEGGFRMGNPAARVKLVEYGSLTCPHCAAFANNGSRQLVAGYVKTGKVSYEFRNMVLNGIDVTASLLARCAGPAGFFGMSETLYATQPQWVGRISGLSEAQKNQLKDLPEGQRLGRLADIGGLTQVAARYGVAPARGKQCLADPAGLDRLGKMYEAAQAMGVQGTPTFFVNGAVVDGITWAEVEPALRRAGA
ncbi:MAG: DsbA family protein [Alphaproteobacteria bacterium]|nr:DsbA family protein [Alphaproteobacteria bacterium]MBV9373147.1 DsbA family protein [Alphaproteobacteria bacterium]MBV9900236.1 DsbA family protein [Alphaproteobacteria bacterium]